MAGLRDDAQWIVLMGFIVSFALFFLAVVINQSTVIGQTTAESVSEFPKNDIRGVRDVIIQSAFLDNQASSYNRSTVQNDIKTLALSRQNTALYIWNGTTMDASGNSFTNGEIVYNNGVIQYKESWSYHG